MAWLEGKSKDGQNARDILEDKNYWLKGMTLMQNPSGYRLPETFQTSLGLMGYVCRVEMPLRLRLQTPRRVSLVLNA